MISEPTMPSAVASDSESSRRPVAVLIAYSCGPGAGSESGVGWTWAKAASDVVDVILITHSTGFRPDIEAAIATDELPITVHFLDLPRWLIALCKGKVLGTVKYCIWQAAAGRAVRRYERQQTIHAVHHVTWASDSLPSALLAAKAPVRVWGPVGGVTRTAPGLYRYLTPVGKVSEVMRVLANGLLRVTSGTAVARHATLVVALNRDVEARWRSSPAPVVLGSNVAIEDGELAMMELPAPEPDPDRQRVALFVGRLVPWKGLLLAVHALRYASNWKLVVLGEGPDCARAEALAARLGLQDRLEFRGNVPRAEVLAAFRTADALLFPSFHDSASWAVGEAASLGCPVVCLDAGGPALQAGRNAHVVPITPAATLPKRIGARLEGLSGRGVPETSLHADRLPELLRGWYIGSSSVVPDGRGADQRVGSTESKAHGQDSAPPFEVI